LIEDNSIGYIRLAEMDDHAARLARELMPRFRATRGMIIDVRGNGGGSRDALLALLPHVLPPDSPPRVLNIAAYRLNDTFSADHLAERFMYRRDDARWSDAERQAIDRAMATFKPSWLPPERDRDFSDWHFLIVSREAAAKANANLYHYHKPVIVLCDGDCFSATDIFLGAFKGLPNVTVLGTASSGGSGRKQSLRLPNSGLTASLSSMISFLPDGSMFDLNGVHPDIIVEPLPTDFVIAGGSDTQLDAAIKRILAE
jgi:C-terminal processing protease CtpA/Prc